MKLEFNTPNPSSLKNEIIKMIEDGELKTWEIHLYKDYKYLKHTDQWGKKGVIELTPDEILDKLEVQVLKFKKSEDKLEDFEGYYYGRFCEIVFVNFADRFTSIDKK